MQSYEYFLQEVSFACRELIYSRYKPSPIFQIGCIGEGLFLVIECTGFYLKSVVFLLEGLCVFALFGLEDGWTFLLYFAFISMRPAAGIEAGRPQGGGAVAARRGGDLGSHRSPLAAPPPACGLALKARPAAPKKMQEFYIMKFYSDFQ